MKPQRRSFLKTGSMAIASLAFASRAMAQQKLAPLDEKDAAAQALGCKNDAAQADRKA